MKNLTNDVKTILAIPATVAGTTAITSSIIDTANFETIRLVLSMGTITSGAVTTVKAQQNTANSASGMADLAGSSVTIPDTGDDSLYILEITRPAERYVCFIVSRATQNAVINGGIVELANPRVKPVAQDATVIAQEIWASPAEGTA